MTIEIKRFSLSTLGVTPLTEFGVLHEIHGQVYDPSVKVEHSSENIDILQFSYFTTYFIFLQLQLSYFSSSLCRLLWLKWWPELFQERVDRLGGRKPFFDSWVLQFFSSLVAVGCSLNRMGLSRVGGWLNIDRNFVVFFSFLAEVLSSLQLHF